MTINSNGNYVPILLITLILLASIICGLIFVICTIVLCKFCYERQRQERKTEIRCDSGHSKRVDSNEKKLCRKLLGQDEISKSSQKIILKALDSDLDSLSESNYTNLVNAFVQTDESCFQIRATSGDEVRKENIRTIVPTAKRFSSPNPNEFKAPMHSKSRVKVQIQNYITPISNSNSLQISQSVIRRYSDNSPYKDDEAIEAESYSRGRSASQTPQSNGLTSTPSIGVLPVPTDESCQNYSLNAPVTQRRGSHHLRPFDTHWGHTKLCHSMELVSTKPPVSSDERKVHSFDNALGRKRVSSAQTSLFQVRSLTTSTSDDVATSSLEEPICVTIPPRLLKEVALQPDNVQTYTFTNQLPEIVSVNYKQRSCQNIMDSPSRDNYKARKSYVGEFNSHPENQHRKTSRRSSPNRSRQVRQRNSNSSSWNQSQISSRDSITINVIDSDSDKNIQSISLPGNHPKLSVSSMIDPSLSPQTAEARRRQFSRERQSLIQASDIHELHQMIDSGHENRSMRQIHDRDYSIDERSSVLFNEFMRDDPKLDKEAMEAQMREKIRTQRKGTNTPTNKSNERSRSRLENRKAASFAGKDDWNQSDTNIKAQKDASGNLNCPQLSAVQQRRQSIGKMKFQSCDHRMQLPVIILPDESP